MAFWKFIGSQAEYFPAIGLTAQPGYVYDLGIYPPPDDPRAADGALQPSPANKWQSDAGPATDGAVRQVTDLTAYGFSGGGGGGSSAWSAITGKPAVIAAGDTEADARSAIGAGTASFDDDFAQVSPDLGTWAARITALARAATVTVAAANSSAKAKAAADYVCTGTSTTGGDEVTINAAINALPSGGGWVQLMDGTFWRTGAAVIDRDSVILAGQGWGFSTTICAASNATGPAGLIVGSTKHVFQSGGYGFAIQGGASGIQSGTGHGMMATCSGLVYKEINFQYIEGDNIHLTAAAPNAPHSTLSSTLTLSAKTSLPVAALTQAIPAGKIIVVYSTDKTQRQAFTTTGAAVGATSIPITSATPVAAFPSGSTVTYWGTTNPYIFEIDIEKCTGNKVGGNGLFVDQYHGSVEFTRLRFDGGDDANSAGQGILSCASEVKFDHCHLYRFANGYQFGNAAGTCFPSQISIVGGESETNTHNGVLLYNALNVHGIGVQFYDNGDSDIDGTASHWVHFTETDDVEINSVPSAYVTLHNGCQHWRLNGNAWTSGAATGVNIVGTTNVTDIQVNGSTIVAGSVSIAFGTATNCEVTGSTLTGNVTETSGGNGNTVHDNLFLSGSITLTGAQSDAWANKGITNSPAAPRDAVATLTGTTPTIVTRCMNALTMTGNTTLTLPTARAGESFTLELVQPATGGPYTWAITGADWGTAGAPSPSTTAGTADLVVGYCRDGSTWKLVASGEGGF